MSAAKRARAAKPQPPTTAAHLRQTVVEYMQQTHRNAIQFNECLNVIRTIYGRKAIRADTLRSALAIRGGPLDIVEQGRWVVLVEKDR